MNVKEYICVFAKQIADDNKYGYNNNYPNNKFFDDATPYDGDCGAFCSAVLNEGLKQQDAGVHLLDVNVGLPEIDEPALLQTVVKELQAVTDLPLQIDTTDLTAMEAALRCYNGKAMVNSVNGKEEVMKGVFPLVAKYGGFIVALTLDEGGIPDTADERVKIAEKILQRAAEYGIEKKDLIFDPLAMTISADTKAALSTMEAVKRITFDLGGKTSLGVSNVSFGLPVRNIVASTFYALCLQNGLSAAIMNPYSVEMMNVYHAYKALHNLDENCMEYISYAGNLPAPQTAAADTKRTEEAARADGRKEGSLSDLQNAIIRGLKEKAGNLTKVLLKEREPLEVVSGEVIPALNIVGEDYEKKNVYLPQLLMAAEAAKAAFEEIKAVMAGKEEKESSRSAFVIATVHGDIHDIGKNIVKLILENYGFDVTDLGKDVPEQVVVDKVVELHAPMVGLSALMTTTVPAMEATIKRMREQAPWAKVCVGGAVLTQEYADRIGADKYCRDAMETVRWAEETEKELLFKGQE